MDQSNSNTTPETAQETKRVRVFRAVHDKNNPYFQMRRDCAQNKNLSYEALGMLTYILSRPDTWEIVIDDLVRLGTSRDRVYRILGELIRLRYIRRVGTRKQGRFDSVNYEVYESPYTDLPYTDSPYPVNPTQDITEKKRVQKKRKTKDSAVVTADTRPNKKDDPLFDALATHVFHLNPEQVKATKSGGRIAKLKKWLVENQEGVTPEDIAAFARHCGKYAPLDVTKFGEAWLRWRAPVRPPLIPDAPTPDYSSTNAVVDAMLYEVG